jgi:hypothetical protein
LRTLTQSVIGVVVTAAAALDWLSLRLTMAEKENSNADRSEVIRLTERCKAAG